jgi:LPS sulfotransferase NodH
MSIKRLMIKGLRNPRRAAAALMHEVLAPFGHTRFRRFIVLSRSRTGSNLLTSLLSQHPNIHAKGEVFSRLHGRAHTKVLASVFRRQPFYVKAAGFKIFYYHPQDDDSRGTWDALTSIKDLYVIHLKRRNILRTLVSRKFAGLQGQWVATPGGLHATNRGHPTVVAFSPGELDEGFAETRGWELAGEDRFRDHPLLTVHYEDLVKDTRESLRRVTAFLGVRDVAATTELRKQNTKSLSETVSNYDQLKAAFAGTEWRQFFDE